MKERPIPFSGDMVQAILEGRKTMTRRPLKPQPPVWERPKGDYSIMEFREYGKDSGNFRWLGAGLPCLKSPYNRVWRCPYGQPGDRLWVRETWAKQLGSQLFQYKASNDQLHGLNKWKSPLFMPRWASRITLEIVKVRVERLQEITERDAVCEGMDGHCPLDKMTWNTPREQFIKLWNFLYIKKPDLQWQANPWVWMIEFKLCQNYVKNRE